MNALNKSIREFSSRSMLEPTPRRTEQNRKIVLEIHGPANYET
jgi:hypothetical protein